MMNLIRYNKDLFDTWNRFVADSRNGTFLLDRRFMDYHSDRFRDASLLFMEKQKVVAVLPANYDEDTRTVYSHQGLTYGGLIMSRRLSMAQVMEAFDLMMKFMRNEMKATKFVYKPIPYIYSKYPSEEDLYALFRHDARLVSRGISSCIDLKARIPITESRKSGLRKAKDILVRETDDVETFWHILNNVLTTNHNVRPVHSIDEIRLLMSRFPEKIKLYGAYNDADSMLAGSLVFDCGSVVHTQYLAASTEGKAEGALDMLIYRLITDFYSDRHYLDFGISTEDGGRILNEGLIFQKEGFGGRGICYDQWEIDIQANKTS